MKNICEYFLLSDSEVSITIIRVGADMDDTIHIQIQIIKLRYLQS